MEEGILLVFLVIGVIMGYTFYVTIWANIRDAIRSDKAEID